MYSLIASWTGKVEHVGYGLPVIVIILMLILTNFIFILPTSNTVPELGTIGAQDDIQGPLPSSPGLGSTRGTRALGFTDNSTGLPSSGEYNFIAFGDFNNDNDIDIAFGGEDYSGTTTGLYAYTGNGGTSWSSASTGLPSSNSWGGLALVDADGDGYIELYAPDEHWGADTNSGLNVWEYRSGSWTSSSTHVSTPASSGTPDNVLLTNITGDNKLDLVLCNGSSLDYYENKGGNPVTWQEKSSGMTISGEYTAVAVTDMNKDGLKDIITTRYTSGAQYLYIQKTSGNLWQNYNSGLTISYTALGIAVGDVNKDSHMDIVFGTRDNGLRCKLGNSGGGSGGTSFSWTNANTNLPTSSRYTQIQLVDIDLDGDLDLIAPVATGNNGIEIYLGNGSTSPGPNMGWTKATSTNLTTSGNWYGSNCYDINNDGSLDIVTCSWGSGIKAYINTLSGNLDFKSPGNVSDLIAINATTNSITVNWSAPCDNDTTPASGPVQSYDIRYSKSTITPGNWGSASTCTGEPSPASPGTEETFKITSLEQGTQYYIALRSEDERPNISPLSNLVITTTVGIMDNTLPGKITDLQAINPTNNSINLTWHAPADNGSEVGSGPVTEYDIRYYSSQVDNLTWDSATVVSQSITPSTPGTTELFTVLGLQPETTYYFAIKARDEKPNWGWISNSAYSTTLVDPDIISPDPVVDLNATNPTDTTIDLTWNSTGDDGSTGNASYYDIRYNTTIITDLTFSLSTGCISEPVPQSPGKTEHYRVTDLDPDTKYYFAIKIGDEALRWSGISNIASNTTLPSTDTILPGAITDLNAGYATSSSVALSWTAPGDDGDIGTVSGYEIRYHTIPITNALWEVSTLCPDYPTPVTAGGLQAYTVTGLLSSTKYYFAIKAYDERPNYSILSNIENATTLSSQDTTPPEAITDLSATTNSINSVTLTWSAPGDDEDIGTATGYDIRYATNQITTTSWDSTTICFDEPQPQLAGTDESFIVNGIFAGTKYYFAIKSYDEFPNYSELSNIASATTYASDDSIPPAKITDLEVVEINESTAILTWTATGDDDDQGTATAYDIRFAEVAITSNNWDTATKIQELPIPKATGEPETFLVPGLEPATTYYFAVRAGDEVPNWSPISNSPSGTTLESSLPMLTAVLSLDKSQINSGEGTNLVITVTSVQTIQPIAQADVELSSNNPNLVITPATGKTDQEGELTVSVRGPSVTSKTDITITADIFKTGYRSLSKDVMLTVEPGSSSVLDFNLRITEQDIYFSQGTIKDGDTVTIYANIRNNGPTSASAFSVRFFVNDVQLGSDIQFLELEINTTVQVEMNWTAAKGEHIIKIEIIPEEANYESDTMDNTAEMSITVSEKDTDVDDDKDSDQRGFDKMMLMIVAVIIVIIILLVLFLLLRRRKPETYESAEEPPELETIDQPPTEEDELEFEPEVDEEETTELVGVEEDLDTEDIKSTEDIGEEEFIESESGELEEKDLEFVPEAEIEAEITGEPEPTEETSETPADSESEASEQPEAGSEVQSVPCPTCQELIVAYSNPCPHCGNNLSW